MKESGKYLSVEGYLLLCIFLSFVLLKKKERKILNWGLTEINLTNFLTYSKWLWLLVFFCWDNQPQWICKHSVNLSRSYHIKFRIRPLSCIAERDTKKSRVSKAVFAFSTDKETVQYFTEDDGTGVNKELFTCHSVESSFECSRKDQQKPP